MAGRTSNISTSSFKPLSLDEIMMVPLAKQKMEDQLLAQNDKIEALEASTLDKDQEQAASTVSALKDRASALSQDVIDNGVSRSQFNKLRKIRSDVNDEFGQNGFVGNAIANKKAASMYMKNMSENKGGMSGGWSPRESQAFAGKQVGDYKGAMNEDGTFNSFSPRAIGKHQNEDKFLTDAAKMVKGKVTQTTYDILHVGGLTAFQDAFQSKKISGADYNTVMSTMRNQVLSSPEMIEHLRQRGEFNNEEDPLDLGKLESRDVVQKNGKTKKVYEYVQGKSRFGQKMANMGQAFSGKEVTLDVKFFKNDIRKKMWEDQYEKDAMVKMYKIQTGEYLDLKPDDIPEIRTMNSDFSLKVDEYELNMKNYKNHLIKTKGMTSEDAIQDPEYQRMLADYSEAKVNLNNSNSYIDQLESSANSKLSEEDQNVVSLESLIKRYNNNVVSTVISEYGTSKTELLRGYNKYKNLTEEEIPNDENTNKLLVSAASKKLAEEYGIPLGSGTFLDIRRNIKVAVNNRNDIISKDLDAQKKGIAYTKVNMPSTGKFSSSKYRAFTDLSEEYLNTKSISVIGTDEPMTISDYMETAEFKKEMSGADKKGYEIKKSFTIDGYSSDGKSYDEIMIRSKDDPTKSVVIQIPAEDEGVKRELYGSLVKSGDYKQRLEGQKGLANQIFMSAIKKSNFRNIDSGSVFVDLPGIGPVDNIKFTKSKSFFNETIWRASMFGRPLSYAGSEELKSEQELALAMNKAYEQIMSEISLLEEETQE